jgi:hypothetical protein
VSWSISSRNGYSSHSPRRSLPSVLISTSLLCWGFVNGESFIFVPQNLRTSDGSAGGRPRTVMGRI